MNLVPLKST